LTGEALFVLALTVATLVVWVLEILPVDLVAVLSMLVLVVSGVLTPDEALRGFGNAALITVACMFVLSAGLIRTGALDIITSSMLGMGRGNKARTIGALMLTVAGISAFMNNTPVAVIFLPVVLAVAYRLEIAPSKLLIPLSYATILGGTCTVIGTSTNLLVAQKVTEAGLPPIGLFDFAVPGVLYALSGLAFLALAGPYLLPTRASVTTGVPGGIVREFVTEVQFPETSALVGRSYQDVVGRTPGIVPLMVIRGEETYPAPLIANPRTQFVRAGDVVLLKGEPGAINTLLKREGVTLPAELGAAVAGLGKGKTLTMVELVVNPNSPLIGRTLGGAEFSRRHGNASVIAVLRRDEHLRERVSEIRLRMGDTLLAVCDESRLDDLRDTNEFIMLEGLEKRIVRRDKAPLAVGILVAVVALAAFEVMPMSFLALAGAAAMVFTGCLPLRLAYGAIDASVLVLIAGTLAMGLAMEKSGAIATISHQLLDVLREYGPRAVLAGMFLLAAVVNALISNNAVAVLFTPLGIEIARGLGLSPEPFVFGILFGASCDFSTPIGYQTNLFVYGPGGYRFLDYLRIGIPLTIVLFTVSMILIPWFWPFVPVLP
jgi:di/tricarboxylate transporter